MRGSGLSRSPTSKMGPRVSREIATMLATRLSGLRNTGCCRLVRCVQVVCELPQVTHSKAQPLTVNTVVIGLFHHPLNGRALSRSR